MKKILFFLLTVLMLVSCATTGKNEVISVGNIPEVEITDDEYRNWYEIFVWSFYDTDNNGIGDFNGVTEKLDYIKDMGFNGIWLMPVMKGTSYHKYDVEDYYAVDPDYGTMDDFENLLEEAHKRGIRIIIDLVVNHSSSSCPWFREACEYIAGHDEVGGEYGAYYNFQKKYEAGYSPVPGADGWYYEARFTSTMPDFNLDSKDARDEIVSIMKFWLDKGVDGFRLDATTSYYTYSTQKSIEFLSWLNEEAKKIRSDCYLVGEAWLSSDSAVREYYSSGVDSFFIFPVATASGQVYDMLKEIRTDNGVALGDMLLNAENVYDTGVYAPFLSNHDTARIASFMGRRQKDRIKMAQGILSLMKGSLFVYYGEEIGMISTSDGSDPYKRIAMKWCDRRVYEGWCYTTPQNITVTEENYVYPGVAEQEEDSDSILSYYRASLAIRNANPEIARGKVSVLEEYYSQSRYCCVLRWDYSGETVYVAVNLDREYSHTLSLDISDISMTAYLAASAENIVTYDEKDGTLVLPPYSYAVFRKTE
jgi:alpha-amylase